MAQIIDERGLDVVRPKPRTVEEIIRDKWLQATGTLLDPKVNPYAESYAQTISDNHDPGIKALYDNSIYGKTNVINDGKKTTVIDDGKGVVNEGKGVVVDDGKGVVVDDKKNTAPVFNGMSADDYRNALISRYRSGINSSADNQLSVIQQNLAQVLADLDYEKSQLNPAHEKQERDIHNREFATTESQKELMNMAGWNPTNSGLAVGEVGKIKVSADQERADAEGQLVQALADIARRINLANTKAANDRTSVEKLRNDQLAGAEADALIQSDNRNYNMFRDLTGDYRTDRAFDYQVGRDKVADSQADRNYNYQVGRDQVSDQQWNKTFEQNKENADWEKQHTENRDNVADKQWEDTYNYNKDQDTKKWDYQISRDKILDGQWLQNFNEQQRQAIVQEALNRKQISVSEGNQALERARINLDQNKFNWDKNPDNPDYIAQVNKNKSDSEKEQGNYTVGPLYNSMMASGDPEKWLQDNSPYLTTDELTTLNTLFRSKAKPDAVDILNNLDNLDKK